MKKKKKTKKKKKKGIYCFPSFITAFLLILLNQYLVDHYLEAMRKASHGAKGG